MSIQRNVRLEFDLQWDWVAGDLQRALVMYRQLCRSFPPPRKHGPTRLHETCSSLSLWFCALCCWPWALKLHRMQGLTLNTSLTSRCGQQNHASFHIMFWPWKLYRNEIYKVTERRFSLKGHNQTGQLYCDGTTGLWFYQLTRKIQIWSWIESARWVNY